MGQSNKKSSKFQPYFKRFEHLFVGLLICFCVLLLAITGVAVYNKLKIDHQQSRLQPFYNTAGLPGSGPLGQVVRSEPLGISVPNGSGYRILYRTQRADNSLTYASGMVFIPNNSTAGVPRPVVAWAHGTVGMGDQCAPSRLANPIANIDWVGQMLARGWVVTATDYAGLGTPGTEAYLVGSSEAHDVLNSVRALKYLPAAQAGNSFAVWGHSQGGNSSLFTASQAAAYAPELKLVGTVASAPAAELVPLLQQTYGTTLDWVIGPEAMLSWPASFPGLSVASVTTKAGQDNYKRLANQCILWATLGGIVRNKLNQQFFSTNVADVPGWRAVASSQSAPVLSPSQPLLVAESLTDQVVLPDTTALYIQQACRAGSNLSSLWLNDVGHIQLSNVIAPEVISWINDRFAGRPNLSTCNQPLPIPPASAT